MIRKGDRNKKVRERRGALRMLRLALINSCSGQCTWLSAYGGMKAHAINPSRVEALKESDLRCKVTDPDVLQFAHVHGKETTINGRGRGSFERLKDVFDHPDSYVLLCADHHREYDKEK